MTSIGPTLGKLLTLAKWLFTDKPTSAAIDITHRCNLKCKHCYWWQQEHPPEMSDPEMARFMRYLKVKGLRVAILYGGEPTLRLKLCQEASQLFDSTLIFTNGLHGFAELKNAQWLVSLEGPGPISDAIRGEGVYEEVKKNILKAPRPPLVHMTICKLNSSMEVIEEFVDEMCSLPIKGIGFSFYTPVNSPNDEELFVPLEERDQIVDFLLVLREKYGKKLGFTPAMARQLKTNGLFSKWNHYSLCPVSKRVRCFYSDGSPKPCTYGERADCSRCGCAAVVAYMGAFHPLDFETLRVIKGLMIP